MRFSVVPHTDPQIILLNVWTRITHASSLGEAHRVAAWRTRLAILLPPLPSSNLRLIQALQPGLSRTSDLRRPVMVRPAPGSSRLPSTTAASAPACVDRPRAVNENNLAKSAGCGVFRPQTVSPQDGCHGSTAIEQAGPFRLARRFT